jgi:hypothetical protein
MANRPYMSKSGAELRALFESRADDVPTLQKILTELRFRSTKSAGQLRDEIEAQLAKDCSNGASPRKGTEQETEHRIVSCQSCRTQLRIALGSAQSNYRCPNCKAEFETTFKDGVLEVVWASAARTDIHTDMTEAIARSILEVSADADFATIKQAWRRASHKYHPDKHQDLPERLRRAAEVETKRINEAYRFLERITASEF